MWTTRWHRLQSGVLTWPLSHIRPHLGLNDAYTPAQVQSEVKMDVEGRPHDPSVWMMNITRWASDWYREGGWDRTVTSKETANVLCWMTNISETRSGCKWGWDSAWARRSDIQDEPANCLGLMTNRPRSVYWDILRVRRPTPKCQGIINLMRSKNDLLLIWADQGRYGIPEFSGELRWACQLPGLNDELNHPWPTSRNQESPHSDPPLWPTGIAASDHMRVPRKIAAKQYPVVAALPRGPGTSWQRHNRNCSRSGTLSSVMQTQQQTLCQFVTSRAIILMHLVFSSYLPLPSTPSSQHSRN